MTQTTSWLPIRHAKVGNSVELKEEAGEWTKGWIVRQAGPVISEPPDWKQAIRKHRHQTGDDQPKKRKGKD